MAPATPFGRSRWMLGVLLLGGGGCATAAIPRQVVVRLYDVRSDLHLTLVNGTADQMRLTYSQARQDAQLKVCDHTVMADLLEGLQDLGFERFAQPGAVGEAEALRGWVEVQDDRGVRTFMVGTAETRPEALRAFARMKVLLGTVYAQVGSLQYIQNPRGSALFEKGKP